MSDAQEDLIAAIATGAVRSAIGIIRLSGQHAAACAEQIFHAADQQKLSIHAPRTLVYGSLTDRDGTVIDHILATWSPAPHSYTGEETVELQCHGSPEVLTLALEALFSNGARQAKPGEFTRRAFLNGRMDLLQAEAVIDLIDAETPGAVRQAAGQLSGALSQKIAEVYDQLIDVMAHFHAVLDYPDEDIGPFETQELVTALLQAQETLEKMLAASQRGQHLTHGVPCAIVGQPNAGKSSLLNALLGYERAIVTETPGTTRDTIEERCTLNGVLLRLIDTAGLRETGDAIEQMGVARSRAAMQQAGLILVVTDASQALQEADWTLLQEARSLAPTVWVRNKMDLETVPVPDENLLDDIERVTISAKFSQGLDELAAAVQRLFPESPENPYGTLLTNTRQMEAVSRAKKSLFRAGNALQTGMTPDAVLLDVEEALTALGELTGRALREDITDRIFSRFCVGK